MALLESSPSPLGTPLPDHRLVQPEGGTVDLGSLVGDRGLLLAVTCNHCPYARAVWPRLVRLAREFRPRGIPTVAVNPNLHPDYPEDSLEGMVRARETWGIDFPYLADSDQSLARTLGAVCTPEFFLYDARRRLVYHGRLDDSWQDESRVTRQDLREAMEALVDGRPVSAEQFPSMGCSIKWIEEA
ncbi:MAG TPA: thioredoxin family protein [Myxococcota bacterium]|nr:thioredoxin family protein [Myxococcota bacterium]HQK50173.1 thioredoxin family protein [Myxococcota bacterium]